MRTGLSGLMIRSLLTIPWHLLTNLEMKITRADLSDVEKLGKMNKRLIEDERHPNKMDVQQLSERMTGWLKGEYNCYIVTEDSSTVAYCLFRDDCKYYYMRQLFVKKGYRHELARLDVQTYLDRQEG